MIVTTRFAPSPTGRLHLGHAWSAVQAHAYARAAGGRFLLRVEDIDGTRSRPEHVATILADMEWLGLDWDGDVVFQSERLGLYEAALDRLRAMGLLYPCFCTRADIAASLTAPHGPEGAVYPGTCRGRPVDPERLAKEPHCWRLDVEKALQLPLPLWEREGAAKRRKGEGEVQRTIDTSPSPFPPPSAAGPVSGEQRPALFRSCRGHDRPDTPLPQGERELVWHDHYAGLILADPRSHGDVVLARKDAPASYHLAATVDDAAQGVTHVVRGRDLFAATHVHRLLQALLDLPTPEYRHHPLLAGADGSRLAKRQGAPTLEAMRLAGEDGRALAQALRERRLPVGIALAKD